VTPHVTGKDGREIKNPLRDLRVRQAMDLVIDRQAIVERVMEGIAVPAYQTVPEGFGGYNPKLTIPKPDIAAARKLMAEAGHADGFKMTIHSTNDRYVNDAKLAQAVAQMLARLGIEVSVAGLPVAVYFGPAREQQFTMNQVGWGNVTGESSVVLISALNSKSRDNYGRWNNPKFDGLLAAASQELDTAKREAMLREAIEIAMADVALLPTHFQVNVWAARKGLRVAPRTDELTLAMSVTRE
jgi:peptide/nickel transport system substrate-binding protein